MITHFDSSYVGTVDMENVGYLGTPINDRRYNSEELAGALHKAVSYAQTMDALGYSIVSGWPNITSSPRARNASLTC